LNVLTTFTPSWTLDAVGDQIRGEWTVINQQLSSGSVPEPGSAHLLILGFIVTHFSLRKRVGR
jgi:hypothetical protein